MANSTTPDQEPKVTFTLEDIVNWYEELPLGHIEGRTHEELALTGIELEYNENKT